MKDKDEIIEHLQYIAGKVDIKIDRYIIFGSTANDTRTEDSDVDIIVISSEYADELVYNRTPRFLEEWNFDEFGSVDFMCLTDKEFNEKKEKKNSVYETANEEGIIVNIS